MRILTILFLNFHLISFSHGQDFNELVSHLIDKVVLGLDFSEFKSVCIFEFENLSPRSPSFIQNIYQLLIASLKKKLGEEISIEDEVIGFDESAGYFNLSEEKSYDYLLSFTYYEKGGKAALSLKVFDGKQPEKIISFFYSSMPLDPLEIELIERPVSKQFSFIEPLYEPIYLSFFPLDCHFMDENKIIFLTEKKLIFYEIQGEKLKYLDEINLNWEKPFFPSQDTTGRIWTDSIEGTTFIFASTSISSSALIFSFQENKWISGIPLNYIPVGKIRLGNKPFILGIKHKVGRNYFEEGVGLIDPLEIVSENSINISRELKLIPFYDILPINDEKGRFFGIYLVDGKGNLRFFNRSFREIKIPKLRVGDRLISIGNYILCSKFGREEKDSILILTSRERNLLQEYRINGEVVSISFNGSDKIIVLSKSSNNEYFLHFWRKK